MESRTLAMKWKGNEGWLDCKPREVPKLITWFEAFWGPPRLWSSAEGPQGDLEARLEGGVELPRG